MEEVDSDDSDTQGVQVNGGGRRFFSDPLQFTGSELALKSRKAYAYQSESESSSEEDSEDDGNVSAAQIALRDKEEALVQSALARIRRAQEKGKLEVKLREDELAALETRRKRMQVTEAAKVKAKTKKVKNGKKKSSGPPMVTIPIGPSDHVLQQRPVSRRRSKQLHPNHHDAGAAVAPGMLVEGADGRVTYAPLDYRPPPSHHSSPSRPRSSSSQAALSQRGYPVYGYPPPPYRHASDGARPLSSAGSMGRAPLLPHEEGWLPSASRRGSVSSQQFGHDPFEYQYEAGMEYAGGGGGGRRYAGPPGPEVHYASVRRSPPGTGYGGGPSSGGGKRFSGVEERRWEGGVEGGEETSSEEESESEEGVSVVPERTKVVVPARKAVASSGSGGRKKKR